MKTEYSQYLRTDLTYASPRGKMVVLNSNTFAIRLPYTGVFPGFPLIQQDASMLQRIRDLTDQVLSLGREAYMGRGDSYWFGKRLGKIADLVSVADQIMYYEARDILLDDLKAGLSDWFNANDGNGNYFYYDPHVGTLIGYLHLE